MTSYKHPIGLLGGTFDPIHNGHIKVADELMHALNLRGMQFIPNKSPMHRDKPAADAQHRLAMVRLATRKNPNFIVNDIEIRRPGPTYSIDTITYIREQIPNQPLCLLLGKDVFAKMNTWRNWEHIAELVHLVVINRTGIPLPYSPWMKKLLEARETTDMRRLCAQPGGYIFQYEMEPVLISATEVRKKLQAGKDVSDDVTPEVLRYIQQHHLYA